MIIYVCVFLIGYCLGSDNSSVKENENENEADKALRELINR